MKLSYENLKQYMKIVLNMEKTVYIQKQTLAELNNIT